MSAEPHNPAAARLGMWIFLASELLLFGGLFVAYAMFRRLYPEGFAFASHHLDKTLGTVDTAVLITSSFAMAAAIWLCSVGKRRSSALAVAATACLGLLFIGIHTHEYLKEIGDGALPGRLYALSNGPAGGSMFFTLYFFMTGLHSIHVLFGVALLGGLGIKAWRGAYATEHTPLELGGLYWHLVDLVWIFLYPLFYLV